MASGAVSAPVAGPVGLDSKGPAKLAEGTRCQRDKKGRLPQLVGRLSGLGRAGRPLGAAEKRISGRSRTKDVSGRGSLGRTKVRPKASRRSSAM